MCGIWASLGLEVEEDAIERAAHRGPDGKGWTALPTAAGPGFLGHRLLAITGLRNDRHPTGRQPMGRQPMGRQPMGCAATGRWLTYNGEIYYREILAAKLRRAGHASADTSDTGLVFSALNAWGVDALEHLDGMFALAYFDADAARLIVARDRFGIKPLYMCRVGAGIAFASEIKQFLALSGFRARLNSGPARDFLELGLTDHTAETLWRGVSIVPPGTAVIAEVASSGTVSISERHWYRLPVSGSERSARHDAVDRFTAALHSSIAAHVPDGISAGISLSGGLDSSAVAGFAHGRLPCFSLVHDDPAVDESRFARAVCERLGRPLIPVRLATEELAGALASAVRHLDEPFPSLSVVAQWAVFREARRHGVKVLLTGQGADELLGGYPFLLGPQLAGLLRSLRFGSLLSEVAAQRRVHGRNTGSSLRALATSLAPASWLRAMMRRGWSEPQLSRARLAVARSGRRDLACAGIAAFRHDLLGAANLPMLLRYEDRTAMAHGVEARPPFLDREVVESALALDARDLVAGGVTKLPLRRAARERLPDLVLRRTDKRGFPTPESIWLKGPLQSYVTRSARAAHERFPQLIHAATLESVRTVLAEPGPLRSPVWRIGSLGAWAEEFGIEA